MSDPRQNNITVDMGLFGGDDKIVDWFIAAGPEIQTSAAAANGATSISVKPLKEAIASGAKVRFGFIPGARGSAGLVVTLSGAAVFGATTLSVNAISGAIPSGMYGAKCQDVTGYMLSFTVRLRSDSAVLLTKAVTLTTATEGAVRVTLTDTDTETTLTPGTTYVYRLRRTDDGFEDTFAYGDLVLRE